MTAQILLVDDEPDFEALVVQRFRRQIREGSIRFIFARDGVEALELLKGAPDCEMVVTDINMPRMDGLTLLGHLQEHDPRLATIIVSAYGDMSNIRTAMNLGALDFLTKPIDLGDLETTIGKTLSQVAERRRLFSEKAEAERARSALSRYFSPQLAERLASDPRFLEIGGERRVGTFLFTDLANFTPIVETCDPTAVVQLLNAYIDGVSQIVFAHEGTVVKVFGDAVYAMFGAPLDQPKHARMAVACALQIDAFARSFEAQQAEAGMPLGATRIGVNTGSAIIGNFGGSFFFDYTAHGDAINVAARLEAANKRFGTRICVGGSTAQEIEGFPGRPIGELLLKGKASPMLAYEPLTEEAFLSGQCVAYRQAYEKMTAGDTAAARQAFAGLASQAEDDPLALFHLRRLLAGESGVRIDLQDV